MEQIVGSGKYTYDVNENWAYVPPGIEMKPAAVAVDSRDRVFCFNRSDEHPVVIFDRDGDFIGSWGAGMFRFPHAIRFDAQDRVWLTDEHHQQFMQFTSDGKLLRTIGEKGHRSATGVPDDDFSSQAWRKVPKVVVRSIFPPTSSLVPERRHVHDRRLRQCAGSQVLCRRSASVLVG